MADKDWQAGGKILIPALAVACLVAIVVPFGVAWGVSKNFAPTSYIGSAGPNMVLGLLIGGGAVCSFPGGTAPVILSARRQGKRSARRGERIVTCALKNPNTPRGV